MPTIGDFNPFSTRFIRPGAVAYLFPEGETADTFVERLQEHGWWGQIIGPHGSGKSTLLAALAPALEAAGRRVVSVTLHLGEHRLPALGRERGPSTLLVIDGYEQLGWFSRRRVKSRCRMAGWGLLVTAHRDMRLPTVYETRPSERLASAVVAKLLPEGQNTIRETDIEAAYAATQGNVRETLFRLFDVYQDRRLKNSMDAAE